MISSIMFYVSFLDHNQPCHHARPEIMGSYWFIPISIISHYLLLLSHTQLYVCNSLFSETYFVNIQVLTIQFHISSLCYQLPIKVYRRFIDESFSSSPRLGVSDFIIHKGPGTRFNIKTVFPGMGIPMLKIRRSRVPKCCRLSLWNQRVSIHRRPNVSFCFAGQTIITEYVLS